jgi:two-component system response regulator RegX3
LPAVHLLIPHVEASRKRRPIASAPDAAGLGRGSAIMVMRRDQGIVLLVEDEPSYVDALSLALDRAGFTVAVARDGHEALALFDTVKPRIVLLDLMLPRLSGIDVCRQIRLTSDVPIIIVTARCEEIDAVVGLELGADDYVTKPYRMSELIARMHAVLRRGELGHEREAGPENLDVGDVRLDPERHEVWVRGREVQMPLKEFEILHLLLANAGRVLTRENLVHGVWGSDYVGDTKTLDVHIKRLRSRIEEEPSSPKRITTIRGVGYRYERGARSAAG